MKDVFNLGKTMAKDRLFFLLSFAFLGIIAAFLFRANPAPPPGPITPQVATSAHSSTQIEILSSTAIIKPHDHFNATNSGWTNIDAADLDPSLVVRSPEVEKQLANALSAKEIPAGKRIPHSDIFWPIEQSAEEGVVGLSPGKRAIPFLVNKRSGLLDYVKPQGFVDITFNAKSDSGFGAANLTLLRNIRVLSSSQKKEEKTSEQPSLPPEILLEMTPRQADIFYYAQDSGELGLELPGDPDEEEPEIVKKLLTSQSPADFRSILVTHFIRSLFPKVDIQVTMMPNGYIVSGKVTKEDTERKILDVIGKLSPNGNQSVVSLLENDSSQSKNESAELSLEPEVVLQPTTGKQAVLFSTQDSILLEQIKPAMIVDIKFHSNTDLGFGSVNLVLLKSIAILGFAPNTPNTVGGEGKAANVARGVILEMSPRESEIFQYAQNVGTLTLVPTADETETPPNDNFLSARLSESSSSEDFRSTLITYMVQKLFPGVHVNINATAKAYVVEGEVSDPQKADKILEIIQKLASVDDKSTVNLLRVEPQQVLINVKVLEVDSNIKSRIGINWQVLFNHDNGSAAFAAVFPPPPALTPDYFVSANNVLMGNFNLSALVNMLEEADGTKVLAEPNLTTTSGKKATFFAGGEFPILIPQGGTLAGTVTVEFKRYGVLLDFTPTVDLNGLVTMQIAPEISAIDRSNSVVLSGFVIPGLTTRRVDTFVKLWPGQSYVIGGLLQSQEVRKNSNLFGLNKLPILGPLFSSKSFETQKTELMIIVTPFLLTTEKPDILQIPAPRICAECGECHEERCEVFTEWER